MNWQIILLLNIAIGTTAIILIKLIVNKLPLVQALFLQYLICFIMIFGYWILTGQAKLVVPIDAFKIFVLGFFICFGTYCQWRAYKINLSKTSLLGPLSNVLTITLSLIFLNEIAQWNLSLAVGTCLSFGAIWLFLTQKQKIQKSKERDVKKWLLFALGMMVIFGIANFLTKVFSFRIPRVQFLMFWYTGAFLASLFILCFKKQNPFVFPGKVIFLIPLLSLSIIGSLATSYWAFQLTLASQVIPFQAIGFTFFPILAGWFIFKERVRLSRREILAFLIGTAGVLFIIFS